MSEEKGLRDAFDVQMEMFKAMEGHGLGEHMGLHKAQEAMLRLQKHVGPLPWVPLAILENFRTPRLYGESRPIKKGRGHWRFSP